MALVVQALHLPGQFSKEEEEEVVVVEEEEEEEEEKKKEEEETASNHFPISSRERRRRLCELLPPFSLLSFEPRAALLAVHTELFFSLSSL